MGGKEERKKGEGDQKKNINPWISTGRGGGGSLVAAGQFQA